MRRNKWLRRLIYLLVFVLILYLGFWWALFNPLEGSVENLPALVPKDVSYMVHSPWGKLRTSDFFKANVLEGAVWADMERSLELEEYLYRPIRDIENQVNEQIPGFLGEFSVLDDVVGREILIAGNLTGPGENLSERVLNSPFVALTRISFKAKFIDVLNYGFVRDKIPNLTAYRDIFEFDVGEENVRPGAPETARYRYFRRIKDVLIVSNDRDLMQATVRFGLAGSGAGETDDNLPRDYWYFYDVGTPSDEPGVTAWFRVSRADSQLEGELEGPGQASRGEFADFMKVFFPVGLTRSITLRVGVESDDVVPIEGSIRMKERDDFPPQIFSFHHEQGEDLATGIDLYAKMIPQDGTFGFAKIRMAPRDFLLSIFTGLDSGSREALFGTEGDQPDAWNEKRIAEQFGDWFEDGVGVAWSRLPEAAEIDLDTFDGGVPKPLPGTSIIMDVKAKLNPDDFLAFLSRNHEKFSFDPPKEIPSATGRLFKVKTMKDMSLGLIEPGFALIGHRFVFSTNLGELGRILETVAGKRPALTERESFQAALGRSYKQGNLFVFFDGAMLRPWLMDQRWQYAFDGSNYRAVEYRKQVIIELNREHRDWDTAKLNAEADRKMDARERTRQEADFPAAIQEYRNRMFLAEPLRWFFLSTKVGGDSAGRRLDLRAALALTPKEPR